MPSYPPIKILPLEVKSLASVVNTLPKIGKIKSNQAGTYYYLDIDDDYIHRVYPLISDAGLTEPDYFDAKTNFMGAHISVIYPEENVIVSRDELNKTIHFDIEGFFVATVLDKKYYALKVQAPALLEIRHKYGLADQLQLKGCLIDLHITVGVSQPTGDFYR